MLHYYCHQGTSILHPWFSGICLCCLYLILRFQIYFWLHWFMICFLSALITPYLEYFQHIFLLQYYYYKHPHQYILFLNTLLVTVTMINDCCFIGCITDLWTNNSNSGLSYSFDAKSLQNSVNPLSSSTPKHFNKVFITALKMWTIPCDSLNNWYIASFSNLTSTTPPDFFSGFFWHYQCILQCFLIFPELISILTCLKIPLKNWIDLVKTLFLNSNHLSYIKLYNNTPPTTISMFIWLWCKAPWWFKIFSCNKKNSSHCFQYHISFFGYNCTHRFVKWFKPKKWIPAVWCYLFPQCFLWIDCKWS